MICTPHFHSHCLWTIVSIASIAYIARCLHRLPQRLCWDCLQGAPSGNSSWDFDATLPSSADTWANVWRRANCTIRLIGYGCTGHIINPRDVVQLSVELYFNTCMMYCWVPHSVMWQYIANYAKLIVHVPKTNDMVYACVVTTGRHVMVDNHYTAWWNNV